MQASFSSFERADCTTKHFGNHALRLQKLADQASIVRAAPTRRFRRKRRKHARRGPELAPELGGPRQRRVQNVPASIIEMKASAAPKLASEMCS